MGLLWNIDYIQCYYGLNRHILYIAIVLQQPHIVRVETQEQKKVEYIIVQAGGRGSRLGYLTKNKPKAMVPVENIPMLFHLFRKFGRKKFIIIADYKKEVLREYLSAFADVKYQVVDAVGTGTCAGIALALRLIPENQSFMLIWSDLVLPEEFELPLDYKGSAAPQYNYVGISKLFLCRWSYANGKFVEKPSCENGVAGFFLFKDKGELSHVPESGEFVQWLQREDGLFREINLAGTKEFGVLEEYKKLDKQKCRPFNRVTSDGNIFVKEAIDRQGERLARRESTWYKKARKKSLSILPRIYDTEPLRMEYIKGSNIYECNLDYENKKQMLEKLVSALEKLHVSEQIPADSFSLKEVYFNKTIRRLKRIEDLVPFSRERKITVNGRKCRNVFYYKNELEKKIEQLHCKKFSFIHGDCTFSNMMIRENGEPVLIDPRGYFGYTEIFGDARYDWAKMYYSIVGNYDKFNLKDFNLDIAGDEIKLEIASNHWEDLEKDFLEMTGVDIYEIKLIHSIIWLSLTTYAWEDYDSICGAFYNGLYYLEEVL